MFEIIITISVLIGIIIALIDFYKSIKAERRLDKAVKELYKTGIQYLNKEEENK